MGRKLVVAAMVGLLTGGGPVFVPDSGKADAQIGGCTRFAAVDAIDSELRFVSRYYQSAAVAGAGPTSAPARGSRAPGGVFPRVRVSWSHPAGGPGTPRGRQVPL